jgi:hypothetical protein
VWDKPFAYFPNMFRKKSDYDSNSSSTPLMGDENACVEVHLDEKYVKRNRKMG